MYKFDSRLLVSSDNSDIENSLFLNVPGGWTLLRTALRNPAARSSRGGGDRHLTLHFGGSDKRVAARLQDNSYHVAKHRRTVDHQSPVPHGVGIIQF